MAFQNIFAAVNNAQISPNNFKIAGYVTADGICPSPNIPTTFSLAGPCGSGVAVQYAAANGERGTFPGVNVACTG